MRLPWEAALALGLLVAAGFFQKRWLTGPGALAAGGLGALALLWGGLPAALVLVGFAALGSLRGKPERRTAAQVLANGLFPVLSLGLDPAGFLGGLGAAAADTLATAEGGQSPWAWRPDRGRVPPGTNAAVSVRGSLAALFIALAFAALAPVLSASPLAVLAGALAGALADTLVGLLLEERLAFWTNDLTNAAATLTGTAVALALSGPAG